MEPVTKSLSASEDTKVLEPPGDKYRATFLTGVIVGATTALMAPVIVEVALITALVASVAFMAGYVRAPEAIAATAVAVPILAMTSLVAAPMVMTAWLVTLVTAPIWVPYTLRSTTCWSSVFP